MHDLITIAPGVAGSLTASEIDATMAYATAEKAASTRAAYASDWRDFAVWCHARAATPLPAHQGLVAASAGSAAPSAPPASRRRPPLPTWWVRC